MELNKKKIKSKMIGLKCVACSATNVNPKPYKYTQNEKFISKIKLRGIKNKTFKIKVPACNECFKKFQTWKIFDKISLFLFVLSLLSVIIGIFLLFFLHQHMGEEGVLLISFGFLFTIVSLGVRYLIGKIDSNPNNYFFYDFLNKTFYVKPNGENDWIFYNSWIINNLKK